MFVLETWNYVLSLIEDEQRIMKSEVDILMVMNLVKKAWVSVHPYVLINAFIKNWVQIHKDSAGDAATRF
ncbi:unnamed protein product [Echinostoma caproni]|uniref:GLOBIN domain-containing protein n=1 Tax=Echinostoma caproni TaxID=27848 RepID=A0A183B8N6_9TREM|nr:unnamed protein product [Echinostoma caproni]